MAPGPTEGHWRAAQTPRSPTGGPGTMTFPSDVGTKPANLRLIDAEPSVRSGAWRVETTRAKDSRRQVEVRLEPVRRFTSRVLVLLALALVVGACGDDD